MEHKIGVYIDLAAALVESGLTITTMLLTLFLSETTPIALASLVIIAPLVLLLHIPILLLSRPKSSGIAKLVALGLALLPIPLSSEANKEFGYMEYGWMVSAFFYLPLGVALVNLARSLPKAFPKA